MEVIVCAFFLNSEILHKNWAVPLKYSFLKKPVFLSVDSYDGQMSPAQPLERETERYEVILQKEVVDWRPEQTWAFRLLL